MLRCSPGIRPTPAISRSFLWLASLAPPAHATSVCACAHARRRGAPVELDGRDGPFNPEIAARLCVSAQTVQHHLGKVFAKLAIGSCGRLRRVIPGDLEPGAPR